MNKLRFALPAWAKLIYLRDKGNTEVSFFALSDKDDPGLVIDVLMVPQRDNAAWTEFIDEGTADYIDKMVDAGHELENCSRIWCHTHPGNSATPSGQDEKTFREVFGNNHWSIMFILAKDGSTTCRLRVKTTALSSKFASEDIVKEIPVVVPFPIEGYDLTLELPSKQANDLVKWKDKITPEVAAAWDTEYENNWHEKHYPVEKWNSNRQTGWNWGESSKRDYRDSAPRRSPRKFFGPGWRLKQGRWECTLHDKNTDESAGRSVSPDFPDWYEKEYGEKYYPPGMAPTKGVSLSRLETDRNLLTEQGDGDYSWMNEEDIETRYTVEIGKEDYIPKKYRGMKVKNVWATSPLDSMQKVHAKLGIPPFRGTLKINDGESSIYIPSPEEVAENVKKSKEKDLDLLSEEEWCQKKTADENERIQQLLKLEEKGQISVKQQKELDELLFGDLDDTKLIENNMETDPVFDIHNFV